MATTKIVLKLFFMLIKKVLIMTLVFAKKFRTNVVFIAIKSYNQLKLLYLVTMATTKMVYKLFFMLIKKVLIIIIFFAKLFRTNVVFIAIKSYNQLKLLNLVTMATTKMV